MSREKQSAIDPKKIKEQIAAGNEAAYEFTDMAKLPNFISKPELVDLFNFIETNEEISINNRKQFFVDLISSIQSHNQYPIHLTEEEKTWPLNEKSRELLEHLSSLNGSSRDVESITATTILLLADEEKNLSGIREGIEDKYANFVNQVNTQLGRDIKRNIYHTSININGKSHALTDLIDMEELAKSKDSETIDNLRSQLQTINDIPLTGEQIDYLSLSMDQGTYFGETSMQFFTRNIKPEEELQPLISQTLTPKISLSIEGEKVRLDILSAQDIMNTDTIETVANSLLRSSVDITSLKKDKLELGKGSSQAIPTFYTHTNSDLVDINIDENMSAPVRGNFLEEYANLYIRSSNLDTLQDQVEFVARNSTPSLRGYIVDAIADQKELTPDSLGRLIGGVARETRIENQEQLDLVYSSLPELNLDATVGANRNPETETRDILKSFSEEIGMNTQQRDEFFRDLAFKAGAGELDTDTIQLDRASQVLSIAHEGNSQDISSKKAARQYLLQEASYTGAKTDAGFFEKVGVWCSTRLWHGRRSTEEIAKANGSNLSVPNLTSTPAASPQAREQELNIGGPEPGKSRSRTISETSISTEEGQISPRSTSTGLSEDRSASPRVNNAPEQANKDKAKEQSKKMQQDFTKPPKSKKANQSRGTQTIAAKKRKRTRSRSSRGAAL